MMNDAMRDATKNPRMNLGKRVQISPAPTVRDCLLSILVVKNTATKKAMKPMRMFWMLFTRTAACSPSGPSALPASTTAPVESTVPPMSAPPIRGLIPTALIIIGSNTIISMVNMMDTEMAIPRSFFFAPAAAPVAIAALVPQTDVAEATVITRGLLSILSTRVPNHHMKIITMGVTIHAIPRPYRPNFAILLNSTLNPITTRPVLM